MGALKVIALRSLVYKGEKVISFSTTKIYGESDTLPPTSAHM